MLKLCDFIQVFKSPFPFCTDDSNNSTDNAAPVIFIYFACANWVEIHYTLGALIIRSYGMKDTIR